jgi:proteasome accessory factor A
VTTCVFGLEAELALNTTTRGAPVPLDSAVVALAQLAAARLVHLRGEGSRMYLGNGSLVYVDCGMHPEVATPECTTPWEAVSHLRAAESMLADLALPLRESLGVDEVLVCRGNVDYLSGSTWGCHESYLARLPIARYPDMLVPHLVSRIVFTGSGGLDPLSPGIRFSASPRVAHIVQVVSAESTSRRGIFHTRDEPLSKNYRRIHVLAGDNACSQLATLLKVGTTALVVALAELGDPPPLPKLNRPVQAMKAFARNGQFRAQVEIGAESCRMSAFDIQRRYLEAAEAHANSTRLPGWAARICTLWRQALDRLEHDAHADHRDFDWTFKRTLFRRELERSGFRRESTVAWSYALERLRACWPTAQQVFAIDRKRIDNLVAARPECQGLVDEARRDLGARGIDWADLDAFHALRQRLCAIEVRFGAVGGGLWDTLDRQGALPEHRVVADADIAAAASTAPAGTRAAVRGEWIKRLDEQRGNYLCDWSGIRARDRMLDLSDPFATDAQWRERSTP